jgi:anti-sigma factor (TIGR02949 family)
VKPTDTAQAHICRKFERNLYHFQAGELPESEREALADHVAGCADCARRLAIEDGFLRGLKGRLGRVEAPRELRVRIGDALEKEAAPAGAWRWLRTPWLLPATAAVVLTVALIGTIPPSASIEHVERDVTVVDLKCEGAGMSLSHQRRCLNPKHRNALKVRPGLYWKIALEGELARRLATDRDIRGHRLHVVGDLHAGTRTLHLASYDDRGLDHGLTARLGPAVPDLVVRTLATP